MNITEAIAELRRGKTIQRTDWHPAGPYVILDSNGVMQLTSSQNNGEYKPTISDIEAKWIVVPTLAETMTWGDLQVGDIVVEKPNHSSVKWCYWIKAADGYIYALPSELLGLGIKCHQPDGATSIEQGQLGTRFVWRNGKNLFEEKQWVLDNKN